MKVRIEKLKEKVRKDCENPNFFHHTWFYNYHLLIVEQIALELCNKYPEADNEIVQSLVWLHDYGKIVDFDNQYKATIPYAKKLLAKLAFPKDIISKILSYIELYDKYKEQDFRKVPLEVQIVSSADGVSHLVGPFYYIYFYEYSDMSIDELIRSNIEKAKRDWNKKIVLPEVKRAFKKRYDLFLEQMGKFPKKYVT